MRQLEERLALVAWSEARAVENVAADASEAARLDLSQARGDLAAMRAGSPGLAALSERTFAGLGRRRRALLERLASAAHRAEGRREVWSAAHRATAAAERLLERALKEERDEARRREARLDAPRPLPHLGPAESSSSRADALPFDARSGGREDRSSLR